MSSSSSIKQEYDHKPLTTQEVKGASSKTIFKFMSFTKEEIEEISSSDDQNRDKLSFHYPMDVDDFERNRALLLWYPEWRERLDEMKVLGDEWKNLVSPEAWSKIENLYDEDYAKYGNKAFGKGECCRYIRSLVR